MSRTHLSAMIGGARSCKERSCWRDLVIVWWKKLTLKWTLFNERLYKLEQSIRTYNVPALMAAATTAAMVSTATATTAAAASTTTFALGILDDMKATVIKKRKRIHMKATVTKKLKRPQLL